MFETDELIERVILIGIDNDDCRKAMKNNGNIVMNIEYRLIELKELAQTAGVEIAGEMVQKRDKKHPAHYFGKGKIEELRELIEEENATGVICDDELSPAQMRNLSERLDIKVMDRTMLILDIFAKNAGTAEAKIQVELAQMKYRLTHLSGLGISLSRLGGGIGTRGPGEKKLETDRRHIRDRIAELSKQLAEVQVSRSILRDKRQKNKVPVVVAVGYTNAGKSTLMNTLTNANVLAENKLFATLDTTIRQLKLPNGAEILFSDTVGFIQKLPHHLVKAFRATLEELKYADVLIHVVDSSSPSRDIQMEVVNKTLIDMSCEDIPIITAFNKMDMNVELPLPTDSYATKSYEISAMNNENVDVFLIGLEELINSLRSTVSAVIPYQEGNLLNQIYKVCEIIKEEHLANGTYVEAYVNEEIYNRLEPYFVEKQV